MQSLSVSAEVRELHDDRSKGSAEGAHIVLQDVEDEGGEGKVSDIKVIADNKLGLATLELFLNDGQELFGDTVQHLFDLSRSFLITDVF